MTIVKVFSGIEKLGPVTRREFSKLEKEIKNNFIRIIFMSAIFKQVINCCCCVILKS